MSELSPVSFSGYRICLFDPQAIDLPWRVAKLVPQGCSTLRVKWALKVEIGSMPVGHFHLAIHKLWNACLYRSGTLTFCRNESRHCGNKELPLGGAKVRRHICTGLSLRRAIATGGSQCSEPHDRHRTEEKFASIHRLHSIYRRPRTNLDAQ